MWNSLKAIKKRKGDEMRKGENKQALQGIRQFFFPFLCAIYILFLFFLLFFIFFLKAFVKVS